MDATQARAKQEHQPKSDGQSWRVRYSKNIVATGTNFAIAGYRYSTSGYYGLQEVLDTYRSGNRYALTDRRKNRAEITLNQNLWEGGVAFPQRGQRRLLEFRAQHAIAERGLQQ